MYPQFDRLCENCKTVRIPEISHVRKNGKSWVVYTCRICKMKDIERFIPRKVWDGKRFVDEDTNEIDSPTE